MTEEGRRRAVAAELALAGEELRAAEQLLAADLARIALAGAYFAVFHAARARLYREGFEPRTHGGVLHLFNAHLVRTGVYEVATSRLLARLQKFRQEADYSQSFVVDAAGAREEIDAARGFVERVRVDLVEGAAPGEP